MLNLSIWALYKNQEDCNKWSQNVSFLRKEQKDIVKKIHCSTWYIKKQHDTKSLLCGGSQASFNQLPAGGLRGVWG